ncbi:MAG: metallophosphoesterase [Methylophilaceae bacterium]
MTIKFIIFTTVLLTIWSVFIEPRWVAHRVLDAKFPNIKPLGLTVIHTSDWHFTKKPLWRVMTHARANAIIEDINKTNPDIVLITGDLISEPNQKPTFAESVEGEIAHTLGKLKASKGVYAVLGNHDNWYNHTKMKLALEKQHIQVLENEAQLIPSTQLWIAGIGDESTNHANPFKAIKNIPRLAPSLIMTHDPASFAKLPRTNGISFSGHTHGGQVSIPWYGAPIMPSHAPRSWAYGWVQHNENKMYVTSGLGVSILPVRFNMRPEWVEFNI